MRRVTQTWTIKHLLLSCLKARLVLCKSFHHRPGERLRGDWVQHLLEWLNKYTITSLFLSSGFFMQWTLPRINLASVGQKHALPNKQADPAGYTCQLLAPWLFRQLYHLCYYWQVLFEGTLHSPERIFLGLDDISFSKENCSVIPNNVLKGKWLKSAINKLFESADLVLLELK